MAWNPSGMSILEPVAGSLASPSCPASASTATAAFGKPCVIVLQHDAALREWLETVIRRAGWCWQSFASAKEFLRRSSRDVPCCMLLAVDLPDMTGLELQARIAGHPELPVIFVAGGADVPTTVRAMKAGAHDFFTRPFDDALLHRAIAQALELSRSELAWYEERRALQAAYAALSPRERQVMALVVQGLLNKQVGNTLGISEITVKAHRGRVMRKMSAGSLARLVMMAEALGVPGHAPEQRHESCTVGDSSPALMLVGTGMGSRTSSWDTTRS